MGQIWRAFLSDNCGIESESRMVTVTQNNAALRTGDQKRWTEPDSDATSHKVLIFSLFCSFNMYEKRRTYEIVFLSHRQSL